VRSNQIDHVAAGGNELVADAQYAVVVANSSVGRWAVRHDASDGHAVRFVA